MTDDESQWDDDFSLEYLVSRFDEMIQNGVESYFDSEEFEVLIDHFQNNLMHEKARLALEKALILHGANYRIKMLLARQFASDGLTRESLQILEEIELEEPDDTDIIMSKGAVYSMMFDFQKAINEYERVLPMADEDDLEELFSTIAFEYENLADFDMALIYLNKALNKSNAPEQILFEIGMCYDMADRIEESVVFFQHYLDENPTSIAAWFNLGLAFHNLELHEKAIDALEYVLAIDETYIPAYIHIGQIYAAMENYPKALEWFKESEQYEEAEALTLYYIGECYEKMQLFEEAMTYYQNALAQDEFLADAWAGIGVIYDENGDTKKAIRFLEKAIELDSLNNEFHLMIADLFIKIQRFDKAREHFQLVEENDPQDPDLWKDYAYMYIVAGEKEKAIQVLKTGLIHQPENPVILYRLVAALILNEKPEQAYFYLESALEIDFEGHKELLDFMPTLKTNHKIAELILQHMP